MTHAQHVEKQTVDRLRMEIYGSTKAKQQAQAHMQYTGKGKAPMHE